MVFTKLSAQEKDAFFGLLDEYFQSRPELFGQHGGGQGMSGLAGTGISTAVAASAVQRALAANTTGSNGGGASNAGGASGLKSANPYAALTTPNSADVARAMTVGRVAAASLAFPQAGAAGGRGPSPSHSPSPSSAPASAMSQIQQAVAGLRPPAGAGDGQPTLSRRAAPAEQTTPGSEVDKLVTRKVGVFNAFKKQSPAGVSIPTAFAVPKNTYGPPPVRRTTSDTSASTGAGAGAGGAGRGGAAVGTRAVPLAPPPPEEEVGEGEWAEVLYDYSSEDPGDLAIKAGTRVFITARSSEDWWTGQVEGQGKEGLFPASYVKLL